MVFFCHPVINPEWKLEKDSIFIMKTHVPLTPSNVGPDSVVVSVLPLMRLCLSSLAILLAGCGGI